MLLKKSGYTLIELLIVMSIFGILIGIAIPNLISFNRRQQLKNARTEIESALRFAQNKALAAEVDNTICTITYVDGNRLLGWFAYFPASGSSYYISGRCAKATDFGRRDFQLPHGVSFNSGEIYILFHPVTKGISYYNSANLTQANKLLMNSFTISVVNSVGEAGAVVITETGEIR